MTDRQTRPSIAGHPVRLSRAQPPGGRAPLPVTSYRLDPRPILYIVGFLLIIVAVTMLVPLATDLIVGSDDWVAFALSALCTLFLGGALVLTCRQDAVELTVRQTFVLTTASWISVAAVCGLPFYFSEYRFNLADSYFEAMSGLTTTGSTVIVGLDTAPPGLLLWRSLLQWLGGLGIIVMGLAILPFLRIGGMQLFHAESSDRSDKVVPRVSDLALNIGVIYLVLTALCFGMLRIFGMASFDAVNHAMTAVATAGFSTKDASVGYWPQPGVQWTITVFMVAGALPFVRYIAFLKGDYGTFWRDSQVRTFLGILLFGWLSVTFWLMAATDHGFIDALRFAAFNVTSIVTTTGFVTADYTAWGTWGIGVFFLLMFIGGCTGSTAGGIKIFRFEILGITLRNQLNHLYSPHQIMPRAYNGRPFATEVVVSVASLFFVFLTSFVLIAMALTLLGLDFTTAVSGSATALANVGPGLGEVIGPAGNFSTLPNNAKWVLSLAMLLGRLEFFTVLVMMTPGFWRR